MAVCTKSRWIPKIDFRSHLVVRKLTMPFPLLVHENIASSCMNRTCETSNACFSVFRRSFHCVGCLMVPNHKNVGSKNMTQGPIFLSILDPVVIPGSVCCTPHVITHRLQLDARTTMTARKICSAALTEIVSKNTTTAVSTQSEMSVAVG